MSHTSLTVYLMSNYSMNSSNLLFSILLTSRASSITFCKWTLEFRAILMKFTALVPIDDYGNMSKTIFRIGMIELRGVLSSWATEEKKVDLTFYSLASIFLRRVMSLQNTIN